LLFVNDRVDVALAAGADGVHLGDEDMPVAAARELAGERLLLGVSVATADEARAAAAVGADYVSVGAIFATQTKLDAGEPVGCERLREIQQAVDVPVAAIGGINATNLREVADAGADIICVVSAVTGAEDMVEATRRLVGLIEHG
jgi:thiamine-phosphate diphosphorylase